MNICIKCKTNEGTINYAKFVNKNGKVFKYYHCRPCNTDRLKKYRKTDSGKISTYKALKKYEQKNKLRRSAWRKAASTTLLTKCTIQGCEWNGITHRHHPDINKPYEVVVLCPAHHKEAHNILKKT